MPFPDLFKQICPNKPHINHDSFTRFTLIKADFFSTIAGNWSFCHGEVSRKRNFKLFLLRIIFGFVIIQKTLQDY